MTLLCQAPMCFHLVCRTALTWFLQRNCEPCIAHLLFAPKNLKATLTVSALWRAYWQKYSPFRCPLIPFIYKKCKSASILCRIWWTQKTYFPCVTIVILFIMDDLLSIKYSVDEFIQYMGVVDI